MHARPPTRALAVSCLLAASLASLPLASVRLEPGSHASKRSPAETRSVVANAVAAPVGAVALGALAPSAQVPIAVVLRPRDQGGLAAFIDAASRPTSPRYDHYLARGQFAARFGPTAATVALLRGELVAHGLRVTSVSTSRLVLDASGTAAAVGALFHTSFVRYRLSGGRVAYDLARPATLPGRLGALVAGIAGTSTLGAEGSFALRAPAGHGAAVRRVPLAGAAGPTPCAAATEALEADAGTFSPGAEGQAYGLDTAWGDGDFGQGQSIALEEFAPYATSDIVAYDKCFGLIAQDATSDPNLRNVLVDGGTSVGSSVASDEPTLDIEQLRALAPDAQVVVYEGPNDVVGPLDTLQRIASDDTSSVVSISWGICEALSDHAAEAPIYEQLAAQGQTVFAASGDSGSSDCLQQSPSGGRLLVGPAVDDPASQALVTGVGGLTVTSLSPLQETTWNDCTAEDSPGCLGDATGGGPSSVAGRPSWQSAPGVPEGAQAGAGRRDVPDLTVIGDPSTGMLAYYQGVFTPYGGTSMGAPLMAAADAVATGVCSTSTFGFLNPLLYAVARHGGAFDDVRTGTNAVAPATEAHHEYAAGPGYDLATGLGSPDPSGFLGSMCDGVATAVASPVTPLAASTWTVSFHAGSAFVAGTKVTVEAPPGTGLPPLAAAWQVTTALGTTSPTSVDVRDGVGSTTANVATLALAEGAPSLGAVRVVASGVLNPRLVGTASVTVRDSADALAPVATLDLGTAAPSSVTLQVVGDGGATAPVDGPGLELRATVDDAAGDAVAGATLSVRTTDGAVARLTSPRTDDTGNATLVARDDHVATASVAVTAGGVANGSVLVAFTDPWATTAVARAGDVGRLVGQPSVVEGRGATFVALVRTGSGRLCVVTGTPARARATLLAATTPLPVVASAPSLARSGGQLVAAYRSGRGDLVVLRAPTARPTARWSAVDLTGTHRAPAIAAAPDVVVLGAGSRSVVSVAAVTTARHAVAIHAPLRDLRATSLTDLSALTHTGAVLATQLAQVPSIGSEGVLATTTSGELVLFARDRRWLADDLASDASVYGPAAQSSGGPSAVEAAGMAVVVAPDRDGQLVLYEGTLGNWSGTLLSVGPAGTSAPADARALPGVVPSPTLLVEGTTDFVASPTRTHRLLEVAGQGVADPYAAYDLTSLAGLTTTTSGAAFLPGPGRALLAVDGGTPQVLANR